MIWTLFGGPLDGEVHEAHGMRLEFPFLDTEHDIAHTKWMSKYGVAYAAWQVFGGKGEFQFPPPSIPRWIYEPVHLDRSTRNGVAAYAGEVR